MRIEHVLFAPGMGAFYYDDQAAIAAGALSDGFIYRGPVFTPTFINIRAPARSLGIGLVLSDGAIVWGDMMGVQYSGAGGRDPLFDPNMAEDTVRRQLLTRLVGCETSSFREASRRVLDVQTMQPRLTLAIQYGVSQALLRATAHCQKATMAEIICAEFGCSLVARRVPIYAQSGDSRQLNVDKMILKNVDVLPHGLINSREKFGPRGENLREFVRWVVRRIRTLGNANYEPCLHFDVYGWIGLEFGLSIRGIVDFIARVADDAAPFQLNIEAPADFGSIHAQLDGYAALVEGLHQYGCNALVVVDERCNTLDDVRAFASARAGHMIQIKMPDVGSIADTVQAALFCKEKGVGAYVGGSCTETDLSAQLSVHVAIATQADMMLAKPGMGVDEALSIVGNEQSRLLQVLRWRGVPPATLDPSVI